MAARARRRLVPPVFEKETVGNIFKPRRPRADLKVNLERADGGRVQFSAHFFNGKLFGENFCLTPKQFGRKLGEIFDLWMIP